MLKANSRPNALLALLLVVPVTSLGLATAVYIAPGMVGKMIFSLSKVWIVLVPLIWFFGIDKGKLQISLAQPQEWLTGTVLGLLMFGGVIGAYGLFGQVWIDLEIVRSQAQEVGLNQESVYLAGAAYWTFINSLLEEVIWRWFVYRQCEILVPTKIGAVLLSSIFFTLHHLIGLAAYTQDWRVVAVGGFGVFLAGAIWCGCYLRYRSIWPSYLSHILADVAIAIVGWQLLFS